MIRGMRSIATLLCALPSIDAMCEVDAQFDRFRARTELWAPSMPSVLERAEAGILVPQASTFYEGRKPASPPPWIGISFRRISPSGYEYNTCHDAAALLNGVPFALPKARYTGQQWRGGSSVYEAVTVTVDWASFSKLAAATSLEFRVCATELRVSEETLRDWRNLIKALSP